MVQLHHRTRVFITSAEFPEPADEFPDARRSIENLSLCFIAQLNANKISVMNVFAALFRQCRQVVIQRQDVLVDPRNLEKPVELAVALHWKTTWHTHAHRSLALTAIKQSTMSSHRSGETFGRHARAIAKRGSLVARCSSRGGLAYIMSRRCALRLRLALRRCPPLVLRLALRRPPLHLPSSLARSLQNARRDQ